MTDLVAKEKALKAQVTLARSVANSAINKLLKEYDLTPRAKEAVKRKLLNEADRLNLIDQGRDLIITRLFPKALAVWEAALDEGNVDVATRVIEGMAVIEAIKGFAKPADNGGAEIFEQYREFTLRAGVRSTTEPPRSTESDPPLTPRPSTLTRLPAPGPPLSSEKPIEAVLAPNRGTDDSK